jgi:protein phosphatase
VAAVIDLTGEFSEARPLVAVNYLHLPVMDLTAPTVAHLQAAIDFIRAQAARGIVYIHCKIGYSRTAAVAGAYLLASGRAESAEAAIAMLRSARPSMIIRPEARAAIEIFARRIPEFPASAAPTAHPCATTPI